MGNSITQKPVETLGGTRFVAELDNYVLPPLMSEAEKAEKLKNLLEKYHTDINSLTPEEKADVVKHFYIEYMVAQNQWSANMQQCAFKSAAHVQEVNAALCVAQKEYVDAMTSLGNELPATFTEATTVTLDEANTIFEEQEERKKTPEYIEMMKAFDNKQSSPHAFGSGHSLPTSSKFNTSDLYGEDAEFTLNY